jgi:iron complex transport system ATP-binding protein
MIGDFLKITDLSCGYRGGFSLKSMDLSLPKGAFAGIIGRNGSGKSTFFKAITGEIRLTRGSVMINGKNLAGLSLKERAGLVAIVPQFMEHGQLTVREYVLMGRIPYLGRYRLSFNETDHEIAERYISLTGLTHLMDNSVTDLSGGELQLTAIASALTQQPSLLLLDEPTSHLDINYQVKIMDMLHQFSKDESLTVVMNIHDLNLAGEYSDHLTLMNNGSVLRQGRPEEVLTAENIGSAYETGVIVTRHPLSGKPVILRDRCAGPDYASVTMSERQVMPGN